MLVRYYDLDDGKFIDQGTIDELLSIGEPVIINARYVVAEILPHQFDWKQNVFFRPVLLKKQK